MLKKTIDEDIAVAIILTLFPVIGEAPVNPMLIENSADGVFTRDVFGSKKSGEKYHYIFKGGEHFLGEML